MAPPPSLLLGTKQQQQRNESPQTDHVVFVFFLHSLQLSAYPPATERNVSSIVVWVAARIVSLFFYRFSSPFCYLMLLQFFFILYRASTGGLLLLVILYCRNTSPQQQQCTPLCAVTRKTTRTPK